MIVYKSGNERWIIRQTWASNSVIQLTYVTKVFIYNLRMQKKNNMAMTVFEYWTVSYDKNSG